MRKPKTAAKYILPDHRRAVIAVMDGLLAQRKATQRKATR